MKRPEEDDPGAIRSGTAGGETAHPPPARRRAWFATLLVACLIGAGAWWWLAKPAAEPARPAQAKGIPVEAVEARRADVPVYLRGLGTAQAFNTVLVRSRVDGTIDKIAFREGQMVREGDVLAVIDPRPYRAALDQALARKAQNEATLRSNRLDLQRTSQLAARDFASRQQFDQQTSNVAAQEAVVKADQAAIDNARTQLDYTTIRSPLTGRLGLRLIDQGNIVRSSDTTGIVEVAQLQPISVIFTAPEDQLGAIREAMTKGDVEVVALSSRGDAVLGTGTVALINNEVDAASGTVRLKGVFPNDDSRLWPGLSVNTRLRLRTVKGAVVVPEDAVMRGQDGLFAFVVTGESTAKKQRIEVGPFSEGLAVIRSGIEPGQRVVTAGQSRLQPDARVEVSQPSPEGRQAANQAGEASASGEGKP